MDHELRKKDLANLEDSIKRLKEIKNLPKLHLNYISGF